MCIGCVENKLITQKVYDAVEAFRVKWPNSSYGPAHTVIEDLNVTDHNIQWCLDNWNIYVRSDENPEELEATKIFLKELLAWPIEDRLGEVGLREQD